MSRKPSSGPQSSALSGIPDAHRMGLVIQGPIISSKGAVNFDCLATIERNVKNSGSTFSDVVISTWESTPRNLLNNLNFLVGNLNESRKKSHSYPRVRIELCQPPTKDPIVNHPANPSRNMFLQAQTSLRGIERLLEHGSKAIVKIRSDMELRPEFFDSIPALEIWRHNRLFVRGFRPETPWFFGDSILGAPSKLLYDFFEHQLSCEQEFVNVHYEHFYVYAKILLGKDFVDSFAPSERRIERSRLSTRERAFALSLWSENLALFQASAVYPHRSRGYLITEGPAYEKSAEHISVDDFSSKKWEHNSLRYETRYPLLDSLNKGAGCLRFVRRRLSDFPIPESRNIVSRRLLLARWWFRRLKFDLLISARSLLSSEERRHAK